MNVAPGHLLPPDPDDAPLTRRSLHHPRAALHGRRVRRRWLVAIGKRLLPVAALALLSTVAFWPELSGDSDRARLSYRRGGPEAKTGQLVDATYHGVDVRNRPYTMTAAIARQVSAERIDLVEPKGDMTLESGNWLLVQSRQGVFLQHSGNLDLSGDVQLYRDDGTTLTTSAAALDLKAGAASGAKLVHAEGPFGALDAQGFAFLDKGQVVQFTGPGKLVLNAAHGREPAPAPPPIPGAPPAAP